VKINTCQKIKIITDHANSNYVYVYANIFLAYIYWTWVNLLLNEICKVNLPPFSLNVMSTYYYIYQIGFMLRQILNVCQHLRIK
jgi:hypothetical protein